MRCSIALPGIVTGMAFNARVREVLAPLGVGLGLFTVIVGHATFCIVVIYNNVIARLRRTSGVLRGGLGRPRRRHLDDVPAGPRCRPLRSAMVAGGLLAFALSFDEVIVTTFTAGQQQTLPIWILANLSRPNQLPIVNVVGVLMILLSAIPVYPGAPRSPSKGRRLRGRRAGGRGRRRSPLVAQRADPAADEHERAVERLRAPAGVCGSTSRPSSSNTSSWRRRPCAARAPRPPPRSAANAWARAACARTM